MKRHPETMRRVEDLAEHFRITDGARFRLQQIDPGDTLHFEKDDKAAAEEALTAGIAKLGELQERLFAQDTWALLVIFQAMDAAGKDSAIKHVMRGLNPQGCQVYSFKAPSHEELDHDFLWRCVKALPERGRIGIFNRSYYEETLIVRVHPELLASQKLPAEVNRQKLWEHRFESIRDLERHLRRNGIAICKFFLHVSKDEQKRRFLERIAEPEKHWKFSAVDVRERQYWKRYMQAYEAAIRNTATPEAPWYVVPADHKWFTRLVVAAGLIKTIEDLKPHYPKVSESKRKEFRAAKLKLLRS